MPDDETLDDETLDDGTAGRRGTTGPPEGSQRSSQRLARILAAKAGFVDAVGYIALYHLFTAHQSGNSDALGAALSGGAWSLAWPRVTAIAAFVVGIGFGTVIVEQSRRRGARWAGGIVSLAELLALAGALAIGLATSRTGELAPAHPYPYAGAAATLAGAMGLQTVMLRQVGKHGVRTTFVSGMLANMAESFVVAWHAPKGPRRGRLLRFARFTSSVWLVYVVGAIAGGGAERVWSLDALALPMALVAALGLWDLRNGYMPTLPAKGMAKPTE